MKIILDLLIKFKENIFTYEGTKIYIGVTWIPLLYDKAKAKGIDVVLADQYLEEGQFSSDDVFISEGITPYTKLLLLTTARPFILFSGESPNVDWKLYAFLRKNSRLYTHAILFNGFGAYTHPKTKFLPLYWPNDQLLVDAKKQLVFGKREKKLVMVVGNKKQNSVPNKKLFKKEVKTAGMKLLTKLVPSVKLKDLYSVRMKAIRYFSYKGYFDLYGRHWNNHSNLTKAERDAVQKLAPKEVDDKFQLLSRYQFALCFENCVYPGYITEKIFDCFFSGCIPIYLGAPDIENFIPKNLFIDMRRFNSFEQLAEFIQSFTEEQRLQYLERIAMYLESDRFLKFTDQFFSHTLMELIQNEIPVN